MNTPSAVRPAACSGWGWEAARNTGGARLIHGRCALAPARLGGLPRSSVLMKVTPSASSCARDFASPTFLGAAMSGADAEHGASVRDVVERGDRGGADGGMAADEIGDADRNARAAAGACDNRRRHPGIHGIARRVGDADHGVAVAVGALGEPLAQLGRVGPEEEANLHDASPLRLKRDTDERETRRCLIYSCQRTHKLQEGTTRASSSSQDVLRSGRIASQLEPARVAQEARLTAIR